MTCNDCDPEQIFQRQARRPLDGLNVLVGLTGKSKEYFVTEPDWYLKANVLELAKQRGPDAVAGFFAIWPELLPPPKEADNVHP